jgi:hypothetical protein
VGKHYNKTKTMWGNIVTIHSVLKKKLRINILNQLNIKEKKTIKFTYQTMKKNQAQKFVNKNSKIIKLYFFKIFFK